MGEWVELKIKLSKDGQVTKLYVFMDENDVLKQYFMSKCAHCPLLKKE